MTCLPSAIASTNTHQTAQNAPPKFKLANYQPPILYPYHCLYITTTTITTSFLSGALHSFPPTIAAHSL